jgi:hypothetical protein
MITLKDSVEAKAKDAKMPPDQPASAFTHAHRGILWLAVAHFVVGLMGAYVAYSAGGGRTLRVGAFFGLVLSQTSLLGIWGGLGATPCLKRLIGVVIGIGYLDPLLGIGI